MALWLLFNCGGGLCLVQYLSWRLSTEWPLHVTKPFGQEFKWLIIMKTKQQFLTFLFIFTISTRLYLSVSSKVFVWTLPCFTHSVQDRTHFSTFLGTEATRPSSLFSHHMTAKCAYYIQIAICKPTWSWPLTMCHVTIPVIIITASDDVLLTQTIFQAKWCPNHGSVAQVLTLLSFCCLYFAFTGNRCLYSAYV